MSNAPASIRTSDGQTLNLHDWTIPQPRLTLGLIHGYGEHAGRYEYAARGLNARGISVVGVDLRGHGRSTGPRGHVDRFNEYHLDAAALIEAARARSGGSPVALFGHSMGALVSIDWQLAGGGRDLRALVLSSPFLGIALPVNPLKILLGKVASRAVPRLALPSGLTGADVCRDPELARLYDVDPLNNKLATARWYTEATGTFARVQAGAGTLALPLLLLYGGADRVASADETDRFARSLRAPDRTVERLPGLYHEILNEPKETRDRLIERIAGWLLERADTKAA